tara:strand:- start:732 stop:1151 length:420 start_codon:yes stop_codon:yes gene_type:complete
MNNDKTIELLTKIFDLELNGIIRYTHYSLMVFGPNRIPLVEFFRNMAKESLTHAELAGEHITGLGGHPPLNTEKIQETFKHDIKDIINESMAHEKQAIDAYYELLKEVQDKSISLEEYCRSMICVEEQDYQEMVKMLNE